MPTIVACPSCQRKLRVPEDLLGKKVKCPTCNTPFTATADGPTSAVKESSPSGIRKPAPPAPEGTFREEELAESMRPRKAPADDYEEEFEEDYGEPRARRRSQRDDLLGANEPESLSNKYSISFGEWFEYAKAHYSSVLGPMIGYTFIAGLIMMAVQVVPFVGPVASLLIQPAVYGGFIVVALAQLKGQPWSFGDFFGGFQRYRYLLANHLLVILTLIACLIPGILVFILTALGSPGTRGPNPLIFVAIGFLFLNYLAAAFVICRVAFFNYALIIDRGFGPIEAFRGSWALGRGHALGLFGVGVLLWLIVVAGYVLCLVGVLFTIPLTVLAYTAGYLLIAGTKRPLPAPATGRREFDEEEQDLE